MDKIDNLLGGGDSDKYNKKTYIGYLKMKNGGMKIIPGDMDEKIISTRNKILNHLDVVLSGGKRLKEKNIKKYFQALGGKYVRNDMCISGDNSNCKGGKSVSVDGAHKLLKLISKKDLPIDSALETFKGSAPQLYEKLETKIKGGYKSISYDNKVDHNESGGSLYSAAFDFAKNHANKLIEEAKDKLEQEVKKHLKLGGERDYDIYDNRGGNDRYDNRDRNDRNDIYDNRGGNDIYDNRDRYDNRNRYDNMYGGEDIELNKFRNEIGRLNLRDHILSL